MSSRIKGGEIQIGDNYVLPVEQSEVTLSQAKVKRIIEETDKKAKKIIDGAESKSGIIVQTANTEAERIIEAARKKAQKEYETIKAQAYDEGFAKGMSDGLEKFKNDSIEALNSLEVLTSCTFDLKKNIIDSASLDIVELVSAISDKVCRTKFNDEILKKITIAAINELSNKESITIIVNPALVNNINALCENFKEEIPQLQTIKILEDKSVSPDGVIVETLETRLDSRISSQISEIAERMLTGANDALE